MLFPRQMKVLVIHVPLLQVVRCIEVARVLEVGMINAGFARSLLANE
jgi:hypothetical protein